MANSNDHPLHISSGDNGLHDATGPVLPSQAASREGIKLENLPEASSNWLRTSRGRDQVQRPTYLSAPGWSFSNIPYTAGGYTTEGVGPRTNQESDQATNIAVTHRHTMLGRDLVREALRTPTPNSVIIRSHQPSGNYDFATGQNSQRRQASIQFSGMFGHGTDAFSGVAGRAPSTTINPSDTEDYLRDQTTPRPGQVSQASVRVSGITRHAPVGYEDEDDYYGFAGPAPPSELSSQDRSQISNPAIDTIDHHERVASPATRARQEELARRVIEERENYLNTHNTSEAGSALDRHMTSFLHGLEDDLADDQDHSPTGEADNAQKNRVTKVNFHSIYGTITEVEHIPTTRIANDLPAAAPSAGPVPSSTPSNESLAHMNMPQRVRRAHRGDGSLPRRRRALPRHTPSFADLRAQASAASFTRESPAASNHAEQAASPPTASPSPAASRNAAEAPTSPANSIHNTVEDVPASPPRYQSPLQPIHAPHAQRPPHVLNLDEENIDEVIPPNNEEPPEYGQRAFDLPLPPHLDPGDPLGGDFLQGIIELRRAQDRVLTFATGMGVGRDDPAVQEIQHRTEAAIVHLTRGFHRAAATAKAERRAHNMAMHLSRNIRGSARVLEHNYMRMASRAEDAEVAIAQVLQDNEGLGHNTAESRLREQTLRRRLEMAQQENAGLRALLRERREENERLQVDAANAEMLLFGF